MLLLLVRDNEKGEKFVQELSSNFDINANFVSVDVNSKKSIDLFMKDIDKIDILINNAFTWPTIPQIENTDWSDFEKTLSSGITSPILHYKKICRNYEKLFWWEYYQYRFNVWNSFTEF